MLPCRGLWFRPLQNTASTWPFWRVAHPARHAVGIGASLRLTAKKHAMYMAADQYVGLTSLMVLSCETVARSLLQPVVIWREEAASYLRFIIFLPACQSVLANRQRLPIHDRIVINFHSLFILIS